MVWDMRLRGRERMATLGFLSVLFASNAACGGPTLIVQQYDGPVRAQESIAILRVNGAGSVQLVTLDDADVAVPIAQDARLHLELLPGRHTLDVVNVAAPHAPPETVAFDASPGRVYRVAFVARDPNTENGRANEGRGAPATARVYEVERGADTLLREVTVDPRARPHL